MTWYVAVISHFHFDGARMRKIVFLLSVLLCSGAVAEPRSYDECVPTGHRPSLQCQNFFDRLKPVRETLRAASSLVDIVPHSVCAILEKTRRIDGDEYPDCVRVLEQDVTEYPPVAFAEDVN
jgi:hypothetical protein